MTTPTSGFTGMHIDLSLLSPLSALALFPLPPADAGPLCFLARALPLVLYLSLLPDLVGLNIVFRGYFVQQLAKLSPQLAMQTCCRAGACFLGTFLVLATRRGCHQSLVGHGFFCFVFVFA